VLIVWINIPKIAYHAIFLLAENVNTDIICIEKALIPLLKMENL
jgi:hypothetical protein